MARKSFDYQWGALPEGDFLLSDDGFGGRVPEILSRYELRVAPAWFEGRRVLDAGCGGGRWIKGFLELGCEVTALDASANALGSVRERYGERVRTVTGDVLKADEIFAGEQFDLVFSWGVLHHTEDTARGVSSLAKLVAPDGLLYLYLYGADSVSTSSRAGLGAQRAVMSLLPLRARRRVIEWRYGKDRAHEVFDLISTPLNDRFTLAQGREMLAAAGFTRVVQTMPHTELFLRADRGSSSAEAFQLPEPERPYWFEREPAQPSSAPA